jgi:hypothetical protein
VKDDSRASQRVDRRAPRVRRSSASLSRARNFAGTPEAEILRHLPLRGGGPRAARVDRAAPDARPTPSAPRRRRPSRFSSRGMQRLTTTRACGRAISKRLDVDAPESVTRPRVSSYRRRSVVTVRPAEAA